MPILQMKIREEFSANPLLPLRRSATYIPRKLGGDAKKPKLHNQGSPTSLNSECHELSVTKMPSPPGQLAKILPKSSEKTSQRYLLKSDSLNSESLSSSIIKMSTMTTKSLIPRSHLFLRPSGIPKLEGGRTNQLCEQQIKPSTSPVIPPIKSGKDGNHNLSLSQDLQSMYLLTGPPPLR